MRIEENIASRLNGDDFARIAALAAVSNGSFVDEIEALGLDPARDFRYSSLTDVDFSNCDLSGFDFSGADLRGSFGSNVIIDQTTRFDEADLRLSIFPHLVRKLMRLSVDPDFLRRYKVLRNDYWMNSILWLSRNLRRNAPNQEDTIDLATFLFSDSADAVVRSNVLFFIGRAFERREEHRDFLIYAALDNRFNPGIVKTALKILGDLFSSEEVSIRFLEKTSLDTRFDKKIREEAFRALFRTSRVHLLNVKLIVQELADFSSELRRSYAEMIARRLGPQYTTAISSPRSGSFDFLAPITAQMLLDSARYTSRKKRANELAGTLRSPGPVDVNEKAVFVAALRNVELLREVVQAGVPFDVSSVQADIGKMLDARRSVAASPD